MGAGTVIAILFILLVAGIALFILWPSIQELLSGAGNPPPGGNNLPSYKNDALTVENIYVSPSNPYVGSLVNLRFNLQSNVEYPLENVEVNFFDLKGLGVERLKCNGVPSDTSVCTFADFDSLDFKPIELTIKTDSLGSISSDTDVTISYSVQYDYFGYRIANVPVIDGTTRTAPLGKYSQSASTYGPVAMDFEFPAAGQRKEGDTVIKEYWVTDNMPFELKMNFRHVGSSSIGTVKPVNISEGKVTLTTDLSYVDPFPCDFNYNSGEGYFESDKSIEIPKELICNFRATLEAGVPETSETVISMFNYTYSYTRTETFTVRPIPKE